MAGNSFFTRRHKEQLHAQVVEHMGVIPLGLEGFNLPISGITVTLYLIVKY